MPEPPDPTPFAIALDRIARRTLGGAPDAVRRLTGGASQETWCFDVPGGADRELVLRRTPPDDRMDRSDSVTLETEAAVIAAMRPIGVPVPRVVHVLRKEDRLGRGFVMTRVGGEAAGRRIVHDAAFADVRPALAGQCGAILAAIHATPLSVLPDLPTRDPAEAIDLLETSLRASDEPRPVFEAALGWLRRHRPGPAPLTLVHGDFRCGNFLVDSQGLSAVLDWEGCHIGDPVADMGWLCMPVWRFGRLDLPVGGFGSRDDLIAGYGGGIDRARLRFWEIHGMLRWGLTCMTMANAFLAGERSIERAAVGRRASEAELELVHALSGGAD